MAQDPDEYVQVKLKTQWGRRKALKIYQRAIRKRNIEIEDLQVENQRLRSLLTDEQEQAFDERYADEDRTGKRNADRNHRYPTKMSLTVEEQKAVKDAVEKLRAHGIKASSLGDHLAEEPEKLTPAQGLAEIRTMAT